MAIPQNHAVNGKAAERTITLTPKREKIQCELPKEDLSPHNFINRVIHIKGVALCFSVKVPQIRYFRIIKF